MKRDDSGFLIDSVVETRPFSRAKFNQSFRCKPAAVADRKAHRRSDSSVPKEGNAAEPAQPRSAATSNHTPAAFCLHAKT
jgi:hypothetical protein